ncbi:unnamed protein product, partial [marine sediment metagenome]
WTATLLARDQYGTDVPDATVRVRYLDEEWFVPGTAVSLPKGYKAYIQGAVPNNATGPGADYVFTDGLDEINPGFWTVAIAARDQNGVNVPDATVRLRYVGKEWYTAGETTTTPKGFKVYVQGKVPNVTGPGYYVTLTDGVTEIDPGFQTFSVTCRAGDDTVAPDGLGYLRYVGGQYYADSETATVPLDDTIDTKSRRLALYANVYDKIVFGDGVDVFDA